MKDIFSRYIQAPNPELTFNKCSFGAFESFVDEDFGASPDFSSQIEFPYKHYLRRLMWPGLMLQGSKSAFFLNKFSPPGYESDGSGLRPPLEKV